VFCRHVLEHLEQPLEAINQMRELMGPNGELYLVLPKEEHYSVNIAPDTDQHLYCWNFRALNNLVFRSGLTPYVNSYRYSLGRACVIARSAASGAGFLLSAHSLRRAAAQAQR
jgi:hypothetical protein